jgi:hypothetical protein
VDDSLSVPVPSRPPSACSHISVASSTQTFSSAISFDVEISTSMGASEFEHHRRSESGGVPSSAPSNPSFAISSLVEGMGPGPSAQSQEDLNEGNSKESVPLTNLRPHASSDNSRLSRTCYDGASPLAHPWFPQDDQSNTRGESSVLRRPLSPPTVASTSQDPTHLQMQGIRQSFGIGTSPWHVWSLWDPSLPPHINLEASTSAVPAGLGLSLGNVHSSSPQHPPLPQPPVVETRQSNLIRLRPESIGAGSSMGDDTYPCNAAPRDRAYSQALHMSPGTRDRTQGVVGVQLVEGTAPSPRSVPLPLSPASSPSPSVNSSSSAHSQIQPSHRHRPDMPLYPSLSDDGDARLLSPSGLGLDIAFGLPMPALSHGQVPALILSPSMDPRSPVHPRTQIPRNFMRLLRVSLHFYLDPCSRIRFQNPFFRSSVAPCIGLTLRIARSLRLPRGEKIGNLVRNGDVQI